MKKSKLKRKVERLRIRLDSQRDYNRDLLRIIGEWQAKHRDEWSRANTMWQERDEARAALALAEAARDGLNDRVAELNADPPRTLELPPQSQAELCSVAELEWPQEAPESDKLLSPELDLTRSTINDAKRCQELVADNDRLRQANEALERDMSTVAGLRVVAYDGTSVAKVRVDGEDFIPESEANDRLDALHTAYTPIVQDQRDELAKLRSQVTNLSNTNQALASENERFRGGMK